MNRPRVLILGATGLLGSELTRRLDDDFNVRPISHLQCDITDPAAVRDVLRHGKAAWVINTAAYSDVDGCESDPEKAAQVNTTAAIDVAQACVEAGARLVFFSSDYVFDGLASTPYLESAGPNPINVYGQTKLEAERGIADVLPEALIIRTAWLYGHHGRDFIKAITAAARKLLAMKESQPLRVVNDQIGNPTDVSELCEQVKVLLDKQASGLYHATCAGETSWFDYARLIVDTLSLNVDVYPITSEELGRPARRPKYSSLRNARLLAEGIDRMRHFEVVLKEYLSRY